MTENQIALRNAKIAATKQAKLRRKALKGQRVSEALLSFFQSRENAKARKSAKIRKAWRQGAYA